MKKVIILVFSFILFTSNFATTGNDYLQNYLTSEYQDFDDILRLYGDKQNDQANIVKRKTKLQAFLYKISNSPAKINAAFDWVANHLDIILTKKGAIKTLLILGPLFSIYCYFFPPEPVNYIINKITNATTSGATNIATTVVTTAIDKFKENKKEVVEVLTELTQIHGELQGIYDINRELGQANGFWSGFWDSPGDVIAMKLEKAISYGITIGIPFLIGAYSKDIWIAGMKKGLEVASTTIVKTPIN